MTTFRCADDLQRLRRPDESPWSRARHAIAWRAALYRGLAVLALVAFGGAAAAADKPGAEKPQAEVLYHNYCSVCHGDRGDGKSRASGSFARPPRDFTAPAARRELTREGIAAVIAHGLPGTAMVGWKTQLSEADIAALADHVMTRFVLGGAPAEASADISGTRAHGGRQADAVFTPATVDLTAGLPNGLKGDPKRGGAFYLANCATCHGARGDGAGPRAYFINPKPRSFIEAVSRVRFNRPALYAAISEGRLGSEMPAWNKVASPQQIADVSEYVFQAFVRGTPKAEAAAARTPR